MDFSTVVKTETTYPVKIKMLNGEDTTIVINVVSNRSKRVTDAVRNVTRERFKREAAGEEYDFVAAADAVERATFIAAIDSWDFGGGSWGELGEDPDCNDTTKAFLYDDSRAYWINEQVWGVIRGIENFTEAKSHPVPKPSKRK